MGFERRFGGNSNTYNNEIFGDSAWRTKNPLNSLSQGSNHAQEEGNRKLMTVKNESSQRENVEGSDYDEEDEDSQPLNAKYVRRGRRADGGKPSEIFELLQTNKVN